MYSKQDEGLIAFIKKRVKTVYKVLENYEHISFLEELLYLSET